MTSDQQIPEPENRDEQAGRAGQAEQAVPSEASAPGSQRRLGFWLKLVDRRLSEEIERVLAEDDLTRRDWRMLNLLAGTARDEHLAAKLEAKPGLVHGLAERGWVEGTPPSLTAEGREALDRLTERVGAVRARVAGAVSPEDFATTVASLEAIARELGWDESQPLPRGRRGGRGFGRRHGGFHGHGHGHGFGHGHGRRDWAGRGFDEHGFGEHGFGRGEQPEHGFGEHRFSEHGFGRGEQPEHGFDPREHFGPAEHGEPRAHGEGEYFDPRDHFGSRSRFGHGPRRPRQDVHVHVHVHDAHRRPRRDA
ncbi:MarR family winged helix-turn-helix transcriptional regulator [Agromyces aerolatus]|uniref:MarR family winged helix-turn-helix transcriptional regulator n=1 Tax=Agromyces sp. LY-1074 TaxID=3074080 RepID=UPI002854640F|nr:MULTISPECIES: hypothetical protein [unclassified Agromyces]MDR5700975.1 hypothetical protein [Agromyces sp. LY-1074]MDR5707364.1 hypothetical protein [Agromyces sp. LY-1358]